jgi:hypothetical protein
MFCAGVPDGVLYIQNRRFKTKYYNYDFNGTYVDEFFIKDVRLDDDFRK